MSRGHAETLPAVRQSPARPTSSVTTAFAPAHHVLRHLLHEHRPASPKCAPRIATSLAQPDHGPRPARPRLLWCTHRELCGHSQRGLRWQGSSIGHRRLAFWVQTRTILAAAPNAGSGERACGRCNGPATLVWEHVVRRAPPIARSLRAARLQASARRTEIRQGTARLTIAASHVAPLLARRVTEAPSERIETCSIRGLWLERYDVERAAALGKRRQADAPA